MKKIIPILVLFLLAVGGGAFYGGMKYGQSTFQGSAREDSGRFTQNQENIEGNFQREAGTNFLSGEVTAKDEESLTLKMPNGSSKIVFFSDSAKISKTIEGSVSDIEIGKQITVTGDQNSDGSYTAKTIQISLR